MRFNATDFWQASLALYADKRVAEQCLQWQNQAHANINLMLLCLWFDEQEIDLSQAQIAEWHKAMQTNTQTTTQTFRQYRQQLKNADPDYYQKYKEALLRTELQFEKIEQIQLIYLVNSQFVDNQALSSANTETDSSTHNQRPRQPNLAHYAGFLDPNSNLLNPN